ncbi:hypothetical protein [Leptospira ilyithenensis]|uniref:Uncharacterized protein n=1 Tax=Leptospira ilyithenensis TaxID=2484901 RepID=A0A4R9LTZ4_9LEPT|nr:hypothetical protein [Leptospira ilyithenensis]TGN13381.1 hypothetical protein EHS11_03885 [Leptospira ilyithenensis]
MVKNDKPRTPAPNLYRSVARNESLFIDMIDMGFIKPTGLMDRKVIPPRIREILILRTCVRTRNEYEFNLHICTISEIMGLALQEIEDIKNEHPNESLSDDGIFYQTGNGSWFEKKIVMDLDEQ